MNIGLYFGSFNPIHTGHLIIANHVRQEAGLDKVWFVVSPKNPLKPAKSLLNEYDRLYLTELAIAGNIHFKASSVEFRLPRPSYTIDTLTYLREQYPDAHFSVIMGSDSYRNLHRWKNYEQIIAQCRIIIYLRTDFPVSPSALPPQISIVKAPLLDISAGHIRQLIREGKSIQYLTPEAVATYIEENGYYKNGHP